MYVYEMGEILPLKESCLGPFLASPEIETGARDQVSIFDKVLTTS